VRSLLYSSVLKRTESDLSKINWLRGIILLNPIVLVPWGRFPLCHTLIRPISAFRDQISILILGCVITRFASIFNSASIPIGKYSDEVMCDIVSMHASYDTIQVRSNSEVDVKSAIN